MSTFSPADAVPRVGEFKVRIQHYADETRVKIENKGTLRVENGVVVLKGRTAKSLLPYPLFWRAVEKQIPLAEIFNVVKAGLTISFERRAGEAPRALIKLVAGNEREASEIAALLPTQTTSDFVERRQEHEAFASNLNVATPTAFVTPIIIAINVIVFLIMGIAGVGWFESDLERMLSWGADFWALTTSGEWWRLLTSAFLHFGVIHLLLNMWALGSVGMFTERLYGNRFFIAIYLFGAIASGLASDWWNRDAVGAGASGAIFAVYGAMLAYLVFQRASFPKGAVEPLLKSSVGFIAYNVFYGLGHAGISNAAHLGGLAAGLLMGSILCRPLDLSRRARQSVPRLALGTLVGVAVIGVALYCEPKSGLDLKAEHAFDVLRESFVAEEEGVNATYNGMLQKVKAGKLTDAEFAQGLETSVIPKWDELAKRFSAITLSDRSSSRALHEKLVRFCETRRDSYRAFHDGLLAGDNKKIAEYKLLTDRAEQIIKDIEKLGKS